MLALIERIYPIKMIKLVNCFLCVCDRPKNVFSLVCMWFYILVYFSLQLTYKL